MSCPHLILLGCFASTHQIAQRLGTLIRNPHRRQISRSIATRQLLSIPPIRLYSVTSLDRYQRGCDNLALDAQFCQLPVDDITRRSCLITGSQLLCRAKLFDQLSYRLGAVRNRSQASHLIIRLRDGDGDRLAMKIVTFPS